MALHERLTGRGIEEVENLQHELAGNLTFNDLLALAGLKLGEQQRRLHEDEFEVAKDIDPEQFALLKAEVGRDLAISHTALEDALTRYNSARYRLGGTWKRRDPDGDDDYPGKPAS